MPGKQCPICGHDVESNDSFCISCGASLGTPSPQQPMAPQQAPQPQPQVQSVGTGLQSAAQPGKMSRSTIISIVAAAIAVIALVIVLIVVLLPKEEKGATDVSVTSSSVLSSSSSTQAAPQIIECPWGYFELPVSLQGKVVVTNDTDANMGGFDIATPDGKTIVARIIPTGTNLYENEAKCAVYELNIFAETSKKVFPVVMYANIVDANGVNAHGSNSQATDLGLERLCGVTPEQIGACVFAKDSSDGGYVQGNATLERIIGSTGGNAAASSGTSKSPFWGVWGLASKDESDVIAEVEHLKSVGYRDALYVMTTDWSNLNSEPWYAVSVGRFGTQAEAEDLANKLNTPPLSIGKVYAKYTGAYQGN